VSIFVRSSLDSCARSEAIVPSGSFANASLTGANRVNGPSELSVSTSQASTTAVTRVV